MAEKHKLKIAVYQSDARANCSPESRLADLDNALTMRAAPLDCMICPELYLSGYRAGERHHALAEPVDGPFSKAIAALALKHRCSIVYGYPETCDGTIYNSAAAVGADGKLLANHRKTLLANAYERTWFTPGGRLSSFQLGDWKVALMICCEVEYPELVRASARQGADLVVVPTALTANWGIVARQVVPTRAFENSVYIAYANHAGNEHDLQYLGASCIVSPHGSDAVRAGAPEQVIEAKLDAASLQLARATLPYLTDFDHLSRLRGVAEPKG